MCVFTAEIKPPERFILYSSLHMHWEKLLLWHKYPSLLLTNTRIQRHKEQLL